MGEDCKDCASAWEAYEFEREKNKELQVKISAQKKEIEELKDLLRLHLPLLWEDGFISHDDMISLREKTQKVVGEQSVGS